MLFCDECALRLLPDTGTERPRHIRAHAAKLELPAARHSSPVHRAGAGARHRRGQRAVPQERTYGGGLAQSEQGNS